MKIFKKNQIDRFSLTITNDRSKELIKQPQASLM